MCALLRCVFTSFCLLPSFRRFWKIHDLGKVIVSIPLPMPNPPRISVGCETTATLVKKPLYSFLVFKAMKLPALSPLHSAVTVGS